MLRLFIIEWIVEKKRVKTGNGSNEENTFQIIFISNIHFSIGIQCILNIENDMKKKRKYSGWQNHMSRTAVIASNALDHDPDANHIFIYEISRVRSIKNKKTNHTTFRTRN